MTEAMHDPGVEGELNRLEAGIAHLKRQYDMFFAGALPHEPMDQRVELERLVRRLSRAGLRKYADRFRMQALVSRFNTMCELWNKTCRSREESTQRAPTVAEKFGLREHLLTRKRLAAADPGELSELHRQYVEARQRLGYDRSPSYDSFARGVSAQMARLRDQAGCDQIELRLIVRDNKVQLTARPGR